MRDLVFGEPGSIGLVGRPGRFETRLRALPAPVVPLVSIINGRRAGLLSSNWRCAGGEGYKLHHKKKG